MGGNETMTKKIWDCIVHENPAMDFIVCDSQEIEPLEVVKILNKYENELLQLKQENKRLKSDLARVIEQAKENDKSLRSDIKILENDLWCPNCANDLKRLKELRKEFKE